MSISILVKRFALVFECSQKVYAGEQGATVVVVPFYLCTEQPAAKVTGISGATDYMTKLAVSFTRPIAWLFSTLPRWQHDNGPVLSRRSLYSLRTCSFLPCKNGRETSGRNSSFNHLFVNKESIVCHQSKAERGMESVTFQLNKKLFNVPLVLSSPSPPRPSSLLHSV